MRTVFADTGYWVAVSNPIDQLHRRALEVSRALGKVRIVTTEMVLAELMAALSRRLTRPLVIKGVERIDANPNVEVVPQTSIQFKVRGSSIAHGSTKSGALWIARHSNSCGSAG